MVFKVYRYRTRRCERRRGGFDSPWTPCLAFTRACSWESRRPPKPLYGVRILALVLFLKKSLKCAGLHATLRRSKTRFDSWQGQSMDEEP
jgi:hypothetical protein